MANIPTTEPSVIRAGDTISWKKTLSDYPATTYTLTYRLINGAETIDITATADGTDHLVTIDAATSAAYVAGDYTGYAFVSTQTERYTLPGKLNIRVLADPATATDLRTHAKVMLDALNTTLEGKATAGTLDLLRKSLGDAYIERNPELLMKWRNYYAGIMQQEEAADNSAAGRASKNKIAVRFKRP